MNHTTAKIPPEMSFVTCTPMNSLPNHNSDIPISNQKVCCDP